MQIACGLGFDSDPTESWRSGIDAQYRPVEPFVYRSEHGMVLCRGVVRIRPRFPERCRPIFKHVSPTRIIAMTGNGICPFIKIQFPENIKHHHYAEDT